MKVKMYRTAKFDKTCTYEVEKITAMPEPDEITQEDKNQADGIMLTLWFKDEMQAMFVPHSFIIEITGEGERYI